MNLKEYRERTGITQATFAKQIGCSQHSVSRYEVGLSRPTPKVMSRIVTVTGGAVTPNDFYDVSDGQNAAANDTVSCMGVLPPDVLASGDKEAAPVKDPADLSPATAGGRTGSTPLPSPAATEA